MRLILPWLLLCCASAGALGLLLKMSTVWGEGLSFWTYAIPWPLGCGLLQLPCLAFGAVVLGLARGRGPGAGRFVRAAAAGLLAAAGLSAWDPQFKNWQLHPWTLFLAVDGGWLLVWSLLVRGRPAAPPVPRRAGLAAALVVLLPVALLQWQFAQMYRGAKVAATWLDPVVPTLQRVLVVVDQAPASTAEGCRQLAEPAPDLYPGYSSPGGAKLQMHRMLELRLSSSLQQAGRAETPPLLTYEWKPELPTRGDCRDVSLSLPRP